MANNSFYSFLPFVKKGISAAVEMANRPMTTPENTVDGLSLGTVLSNGETIRSKVTIKMKVRGYPKASTSGTELVDSHHVIDLNGPGDVIGLSPDTVIRTTPNKGVNTFEPNYLAAVDFYDEDLPWRYTPLISSKKKLDGSADTERNRKLRPWLMLVVLEKGEFTREQGKVLPSIKLTKNVNEVFPDIRQIWAWGHVQSITQYSTTPTDPSGYAIFGLDGLGMPNAKTNTVTNYITSSILNNPDAAISRLVCPRRLKPNTQYSAFLVPTFELGRLVGLGYEIPSTGVDMQMASWDSTTAPDPVPVANGTFRNNQYPYYFEFDFGTASNDEDFEVLARKLKPKMLDAAEVGSQPIHIKKPGHPDLNPIFGTGEGDDFKLNGILRPFVTGGGTPADLWPVPQPSGKIKQYQDAIRTIIKPSGTLSPGSADVLPIIAPPMYGAWHIAEKEIPSASSTNKDKWFAKVNLDPMYRSLAGLGAEVVKRNQEELMTVAWNQVKNILEVNRDIQQLKLALEVVKKMYKKAGVTSPTLGAVLPSLSTAKYSTVLNSGTSGATSLANATSGSLVSGAFMSGPYRRMARTGGPVINSLNAGSSTNNTSSSSFIGAVNSGTTSPAPTYTAPTGMSSYSSGAISGSTTSSAAPACDFTLVRPGQYYSVNNGCGADNSLASLFRNYVGAYETYLASNVVVEPSKSSLTETAFLNQLTAVFDPDSTLEEYAKELFKIYKADGSVTSIQDLQLIMQAPVIPFPISEALAKISVDYLIPGAAKLEQNGVYLLAVNPKELEAVMLGANHEMNRELLWRNYPTDMRGTSLRHFWSVRGVKPQANHPDVTTDETFMDIKQIHQWHTSGVHKSLGTNSSRPTPPTDMVVLAIRGELLKKYPNAMVYARKAEWETKQIGGVTHPDNSKTRKLNAGAGTTESPNLRTPIFSARVDDMVFVGFSLSAAAAKGTFYDGTNPAPALANPGWYFVIEERAGEPVFGADKFTGVKNRVLNDWDQLEWGDLLTQDEYKFISVAKNISLISGSIDKDYIWNSNSSDLAYALLQRPSRIHLHGYDMLINL